MSERIRYAWGSSSLGNFIAATSDHGFVAFEFGEPGAVTVDALRMRFAEVSIEPDPVGLADIVRTLAHLVDHPSP